MEDIQATQTKRKLDQVENVDLNPHNKKIKINDGNQKKDIIALPDLPPEIIHCIISFIADDHQRRQQRLVSHRWFNAINYNEFRIGALLASEAEEFYRIFNRYQKPIHLKFMKTSYLNNIRSDLPHHRLISAPLLTNRICRELPQLTGLDLCLNSFLLTGEHLNLQYLTIMTPMKYSTLMQMTNLKRLKTHRIDSDLNQIIKFPPNLESLNFKEFTLLPRAFEINTRLTELKILQVNMDLLKALPNLKKLKIMKFDYRYHINQLDGRELVLPNLEELETNLDAPDLSGLPNLTRLTVHHRTVQLTPQLTKLKRIQCLGQVIFPENHQSLLQSLKSFKVSSSSGNKTIINALNSQKITQLSATLTEDNYEKFMEFTKLVDLELTLEPTIKPTLLLLPSLTRLRIQIYPQHYDVTWLTNLTNLEWLFIHQVRDFNEADLLEVHALSTFQNLTNVFIGPALKNRNDVSHLTNLRQLGMFKGNENDDLQILTSLQKLTSLSISHNTSSIECLTKLSRLQELKLTSDNERMCVAIAKKLPFCYLLERTTPSKIN